MENGDNDDQRAQCFAQETPAISLGLPVQTLSYDGYKKKTYTVAFEHLYNYSARALPRSHNIVFRYLALSLAD